MKQQLTQILRSTDWCIDGLDGGAISTHWEGKYKGKWLNEGHVAE